MPNFRIELGDGRKFDIDAETQPTAQEISEALGEPIDSGQGIVGASINAAARGFTHVAADIPGGIGALTGIDALSNLGDSIEHGLNKAFPVNPVLADSIPVHLGGAVGMVGNVLATGGIGGAIGKAVGASKYGIEALDAINAAAHTGSEAGALAPFVLGGADQGAAVADEYGIEGPDRMISVAGFGLLNAAAGKVGLGNKTAAIERLLGNEAVAAPMNALATVGVEAGKMVALTGAQNALTGALTPNGVTPPDLLAGAGAAAKGGAAGGAVFALLNAITHGRASGILPSEESNPLARNVVLPDPASETGQSMFHHDGEVWSRIPDGRATEGDPANFPTGKITLDASKPDDALMLEKLNAIKPMEEPAPTVEPAPAATPAPEGRKLLMVPKEEPAPAPEVTTPAPEIAPVTPTDSLPPTPTPQTKSPIEGDPSITGIAKDYINRDRATQGLPPIELTGTHETHQSLWDEAVKQSAQGKGESLLVELASNPDKVLTDNEVALALHEYAAARQRVSALESAINSNPGESSAEQQAQLRALKASEIEIGELVRRPGSNMGAAFNALKMLAKEDFSLPNLLRRFQAANGGEAPGPKIAREIVKLHSELHDTSKQIDASDAATGNTKIQAGEEAIKQVQSELLLEAKKKKRKRYVRAEPKIPDRADGMSDLVDYVKAHGGIRPPAKEVRNKADVTQSSTLGSENALQRWHEDKPHDARELRGGMALDELARGSIYAEGSNQPNYGTDGTSEQFMQRLQEDILTRRRGNEDQGSYDSRMEEEGAQALKEGELFTQEQDDFIRAQRKSKVEPAEKATNFFKSARDAARARLDAERAQGKLFANPIGALARMTINHTIIGASYIAEGITNFAQWSAAILKDKIFAGISDEQLRNLHEDSMSMHAETEARFAKNEADRLHAQTPEGVIEAVKKGVENGTIDPMVFDPEIAKKIARAHIARGVTDVHVLEQRVFRDVESLFGDLATPYEVHKAWSEYGKVTKASQDQISKTLREMKAQERLILAHEDVLTGKAPMKSGLKRDAKTQEVRTLATKLRDAMRRMGISVTGEEQLKTAKDAITSRLKNQIEDLKSEMSGKIKPREPREAIKYDDEMMKLAKERDELQSFMDDLTGPSPDFKWNQKAQAAAKASEENFRRRIATNDLENKRAVFSPNDKTKAAQESAKKAKTEWEALRESAGIPQREALESLKKSLTNRISKLADRIAGKPQAAKKTGVTPDAEVELLRFGMSRLSEILQGMKPEKAGMTDAQKAEAAIKATEKAIKQIEDELAGAPKKQKTESTRVQPMLEVGLRAELEYLREFRDAARDALIVRRTPMEIALAAYKKRIAKSTAELERRIRDKDYAKPERAKLVLDPAAEQLKSKHVETKLKLERLIEQARLANRTPLQKTLDVTVRWRRGFLLSGYHTLNKLVGAAAWRLVITPTEEAIGTVLRKLPGLDRVAAAAPREGAGFSMKAESAAIADGVVGAIKGFATLVKTGRSVLDQYNPKHGHDDLDPSIVDFFGHLHAALKSPAKMAEFHRSLQQRAEFAMKQGIDVKEPVAQAALMRAAYLDANKAIFMNENFITQALNMAIRGLEMSKSSPNLGPAAAALVRVLLPIVKVPTNIVREAVGEYAFGLPRGVVELSLLMKRGFADMPPEHADAVMRHFKRGAIGAALITYGYFNAQNVGGFYQRGEKRDDSDVHFGDARIGDITIPHALLHTPAMDAMQMGATMRRVAEKILKDTHGKPTGAHNSTADGAIAAVLGMVEQVPFAQDQAAVFRTGHEGDYKRSEFAKSIIPMGIRNLAEDIDPAEGRKTKGALEAIFSAIPLLRETLPEKKH